MSLTDVSSQRFFQPMNRLRLAVERHRQAFVMLGLAMVATVFSLSATAITVPATTDFAYDVYDIIVVKILQGPVGFVGGLAAIVVGAAQLTKSWMLAILGILSGTIIIKADSIVSSLGMTISVM